MLAMLSICSLGAFGFGMVTLGWDMWQRGLNVAGTCIAAAGVTFLVISLATILY